MRALIVAPTRELAEQIHQTSVDLGKNTKVRSVTVYGGVSKARQMTALRRGAEIVVACPGRLLDLLGDGNIDLSHVEVLVLDEADRMCDMGFLPDIRRILKALPAQRQTLFFSATMPDDIRKLADQILDNPATVQIGVIAPAETVSHALYPVAHKPQEGAAAGHAGADGHGARVDLYAHQAPRPQPGPRPGKTRLPRLGAAGQHVAEPARQQAIDGFRDGKYDILVATDIAARGIDVVEIIARDQLRHARTRWMPTRTASGAPAAPTRPARPLPLWSEEDEPLVREIEKVLGDTDRAAAAARL